MLCRDTSRGRHSSRVAWLVYVRTYCVPIATLNQNKRSRLLSLGETQIIITYSSNELKYLLLPKELQVISRYLEVITVSLRALREQLWHILERRESFTCHLWPSNKTRHTQNFFDFLLNHFRVLLLPARLTFDVD